MSTITDGLLREDDGSLSVTEDDTDAAYDGGWLRSPDNALVVTFDDTNAAHENGYLRSASGALVIAEEAGVEMHNGLLRTAGGALAATRDPEGLEVVSGLARVDGLIVLTGLDFSDGFESGDDSAWPSKFTAVAGTLVVGAGSAHSGNFGLHVHNTAASSSQARLRQTFAARDIVECEGWFRWTADSGVDTNNGTGLRIFAGATRVVDVARQDTPDKRLFLRTRRAAGTFRFNTLVDTRELNVWTKLGLRVEYNGPGTVSRCVFTVDDVVKVDLSDFDLSSGAYDAVQVGTEHPQIVDVDVDDVIAPI